MKRIISILLSVCTLLGLCAYSGGVQLAYASEPESSEDQDAWELSGFVDDFGDPTGETYLQSTIRGTFSNTATSGEDVRVMLCFIPAIDDAVPVLFMRLLEYDNALSVKAIYSESDSKIIKIKIGDEITEDVLDGEAPNGDLMLISGQCLMKIYDALLANEQDVRFIIELGASKYSFTATGKGFEECLDEYWALNPDKTNGLYYEGTTFLKLENFLTGRRNGLVMIPKQYTGDSDYYYIMKVEEQKVSNGSIFTYDFYSTSASSRKKIRDFGYEKYLSDNYSNFEELFDHDDSIYITYWDDTGNELIYSYNYNITDSPEDFTIRIGAGYGTS